MRIIVVSWSDLCTSLGQEVTEYVQNFLLCSIIYCSCKIISAAAHTFDLPDLTSCHSTVL